MLNTFEFLEFCEFKINIGSSSAEMNDVIYAGTLSSRCISVIIFLIFNCY